MKAMMLPSVSESRISTTSHFTTTPSTLTAATDRGRPHEGQGAHHTPPALTSGNRHEASRGAPTSPTRREPPAPHVG